MSSLLLIVLFGVMVFFCCGKMLWSGRSKVSSCNRSRKDKQDDTKSQVVEQSNTDIDQATENKTQAQKKKNPTGGCC